LCKCAQSAKGKAASSAAAAAFLALIEVQQRARVIRSSSLSSLPSLGFWPRKFPNWISKFNTIFCIFILFSKIFKWKTLMGLGSGHQCHNTSLSSSFFAFRSRLRY
jgi:hypothetical protein